MADSSRPRREAPAGGVRLATTLLLLIGALVGLVLAVLLGAALLGWSDAVPGSLVARGSYEVRALLYGIALLALAGLVAVALRRGERSLWLRAPHGGVLVSLPTLEWVAETNAVRHPDVVRARARLRERGGAPQGSLKIYARPLADAAGVQREVDAKVARQLSRIVGREVTGVTVQATVLRVGQLKKYLPQP